MVEGEALRGPCDDGSLSRHLLDVEPLLTLYTSRLIHHTYHSCSKRDEIGSDKEPYTRSPIALGSADGVNDPCLLHALALWTLT